MPASSRIFAHPRWTLVPVPDDALYLFSEREHRVVTQTRARRFVEALQGGEDNRQDAVVERAIAAGMNAAEAWYTLEEMKNRRFLVERNSPPEPAEIFAAQFAEEENAPPSICLPELNIAPVAQEVSVAIHSVGEMATDVLLEAAAAAGIRARPLIDLSDLPDAVGPLLVLTDDYLRTQLAEVTRVLHRAGRPWLLAKPFGTILWLGPFFHPDEDEGGCWHCLAHRLIRNREVESHVARALVRPLPIAPARGHTRESLAFALTRIRAMLAQAHQDGEASTDRDLAHVHTFDLITGEELRHHLMRRPQCPACGDGGKRSLALRPVTLNPTPRNFSADGGHRSRDPKETWQRYRHHVSPITGAVTFLGRFDEDAASAAAMPAATGAAIASSDRKPAGTGRKGRSSGEGPVPIHNYIAGHNFAVHQPGIEGLKSGLRSKSAGKGMTDEQARASGLAEALERYSGVFMGEEPRRRARFVDLGEDEVVDPRRCMLFSERQYAEREIWRKRASSFQYVPHPFDELAELDWSPVWSLSEGCRKYLPSSYLYYGHPEGGRFCTADSNGCAAGNTLEEAILQGFFELVERDAVAVWWYNRIPRPAVDLDSFDLSYVRALETFLARHHREFWVLDLTHDFGIPVMAAITRRIDKPVEDIVFAFGAHFDPRIALTRALSEMGQFLPAVLHMPSDCSGEYAYPDPHSLEWWRNARLADHPYLSPASELPARKKSDFQNLQYDDIAEEVRCCQRLVEERGMQMLVLDQTRPDIGLPVVKVIVPGMRHFWARFAPGRLYDVPVALGWLDAPKREEELNPVAMFV